MKKKNEQQKEKNITNTKTKKMKNENIHDDRRAIPPLFFYVCRTRNIHEVFIHTVFTVHDLRKVIFYIHTFYVQHVLYAVPDVLHCGVQYRSTYVEMASLFIFLFFTCILFLHHIFFYFFFISFFFLHAVTVALKSAASIRWHSTTRQKNRSWRLE